jgi:hypothetical protein
MKSIFYTMYQLFAQWDIILKSLCEVRVTQTKLNLRCSSGLWCHTALNPKEQHWHPHHHDNLRSYESNMIQNLLHGPRDTKFHWSLLTITTFFVLELSITCYIKSQILKIHYVLKDGSSFVFR